MKSHWLFYKKSVRYRSILTNHSQNQNKYSYTPRASEASSPVLQAKTFTAGSCGSGRAAVSLFLERSHDTLHHLSGFLLLEPKRSVMAPLQFLDDPRLAGQAHHRFLARLRDRLVFRADDIGQTAAERGIAPRCGRRGRLEGEGGVRQQVSGVGLGDRCLDVGGEDLDGVEGHGETGAGL